MRSTYSAAPYGHASRRVSSLIAECSSSTLPAARGGAGVQWIGAEAEPRGRLFAPATGRTLMSLDVSQDGRLSNGGNQIAYMHLGDGPQIALIDGIPKIGRAHV